MSKRKESSHTAESPPKRQRPNGIAATEAPSEPIHSARQLKSLLQFRQDAVEDIKYGIRAFKVFLESIIYADQKASTTTQQAILQDYLRSEVSTRRKDNESSDITAFPSIVQAWRFAADTNVGALLSAIPAVFALLLRTISTIIAFREHGLQICRTLLQVSQLKLIQRGLNAPANQEHLISPCLRLLTEIVAYDGGAMSGKVFAAKEYTFTIGNMVRNLKLRKDQPQDSEEAKRRPAVRSNTARYLLACLRYLSTPDKIELSKADRVIASLFEHVKTDPLELALEIFNTVEAHLLRDKKIPRAVKQRIMTDNSLACLSAAIEPKLDSEEIEANSTLRTTAYNFLRLVCSNTDAGVLRPSQGWFPPGTEKDPSAEVVAAAPAKVDLGLDFMENYDTYKAYVPVRNVTLSKFAQRLRPHIRKADADLVLLLFRFAPELVADYFFKKSNFSFDPNLTLTWIGYASFLFSIAQLTVPTHFGRLGGYGRIPPPLSIIMENLLPSPLTQKSLTRCLTQPVELITFFAVRILCVGFQKLRVVLEMFKDAARTDGELWNEGVYRIRREFTSRAPILKDVMTAYKQTAAENAMQKEAILRLISLYYEILPELVLNERFAVAIPLVEALAVLETPHDHDESTDGKSLQGLQLLQLGHLVRIASRTPDMKWWNKPETMALTPFVTLLKIAATKSPETIPRDVYSLIDSVMRETGILQQESKISATHSLIASLQMIKQDPELEALYAFLNEVLSRIARQPIKYEDELDDLADNLATTKPVSLLTVALVEQWPFAVKRSSAPHTVALWIGHYLSSCEQVGEDGSVLNKIRDRLLSDTDTNEQRIALKISYNEDIGSDWSELISRLRKTQVNINDNTASSTEILEEPKLDDSVLRPPSEDDKHRGLHRWNSKDTVSAILEGDLASLILCLSSTYTEVQKVALGYLRQFIRNLETLQTKATYPEAKQIILLLGLLINTATPMIMKPSTNLLPNGASAASPPGNDHLDAKDAEAPSVPYLCTVYAIMALQILQNPMHPLYEKINTFHTRSPKWDINRLPSYWTHQILFTPPTPSYSSTPSTKTSLASHPDSTQAYDVASNPTTSTSKSTPTIPQTPQAFLLSYIHASLRHPSTTLEETPTIEEPTAAQPHSADLHILQARGTLEPLLALANNPSLPLSHFALLLRILWRISFLRGGSTMLITRKGIISLLQTWIAKRASSGPASAASMMAFEVDGRSEGGRYSREDRLLVSVRGLKKLLGRIWESCDREYVVKWSGGDIERVVLQIMAG